GAAGHGGQALAPVQVGPEAPVGALGNDLDHTEAQRPRRTLQHGVEARVPPQQRGDGRAQAEGDDVLPAPRGGPDRPATPLTEPPTRRRRPDTGRPGWCAAARPSLSRVSGGALAAAPARRARPPPGGRKARVSPLSRGRCTTTPATRPPHGRSRPPRL